MSTVEDEYDDHHQNIPQLLRSELGNGGASTMDSRDC
jgi:hypothetical protein